ncbi:MAG: glycosyltransferase family 2 protein [Bacteroidia bacterium]|nr:glycosyltransferase family 2 protein [Bacteroidia bacterium]
MIEISIVIPAYNEQENIPVLYKKLVNILNDLKTSYEIIFIDDGSMATGKAVITMDCDLQDPPDLIPEMIKKWQEGFEIVYTRRQHRSDGFFKKYSAILYYKLLTKFSDIKTSGNIGEFRLIDRKVVEELSLMRERARFLRGMVYWTGFNSYIINYSRPNRIYGRTGFSLLKMVRLAMDSILSFSLLPLRIGLILGLFTFITGFIFLIYISCDTIFFDKIYPLYKWLSVITFIFVGFMFVLIWILGEYIGKIYTESKGRPIYIIRNKENI